eukprot:352891-Chlamydomonas_euryale.AAC.3
MLLASSGMGQPSRPPPSCAIRRASSWSYLSTCAETWVWKVWGVRGGRTQEWRAVGTGCQGRKRSSEGGCHGHSRACGCVEGVESVWEKGFGGGGGGQVPLDCNCWPETSAGAAGVQHLRVPPDCNI